MEFDVYQTLAGLTAVYPHKGTPLGLSYSTLGLASEMGEIAGKIKKWIRGDGVLNTDEISKELGDALWYVAAIATDMGLSLEEIADENLRKLQSRQARGVIKGSGDSR